MHPRRSRFLVLALTLTTLSLSPLPLAGAAHTPDAGTHDRATATNPRCISRVEYRKLRMTAKPWASGTTIRQARSIIGSLGTTQLAPKHRYDTEFDGYDEHVGLDYRTAAFAFGVVPEYIFGSGGKTRPCKPWNKHSSVVLIFRQYHWKGGHGPWRLVGPKAPTPSTDASGFRGVSWAHWKHN